RYLFPTLKGDSSEAIAAMREDPAEFKARILWNFTEFLKAYAARTPLVVALEALHWADPSSVELFHFLARQLAGEPVLMVGTYNDVDRDRSPVLVETEQSLVHQGVAEVHRPPPLTQEETRSLIQQAFGVDEAVCRELSDRLYEWTEGNPFFIEETLKTLVGAGKLREHDGSWLGWETEELELPRSIMDAVLSYFRDLPPGARAVADLTAVLGAPLPFPTLKAVADLPDEALLGALDALRSSQILVEEESGGTVAYDLAHPLMRETLQAEMGYARTTVLHGTIGQRLEAFYGDRAPLHADELAFHFTRAGSGDDQPKALEYLTAAGTAALARSANREAVAYLDRALQGVDAAERGSVAVPEGEKRAIIVDLARALTRVGDYAEAQTLWERARRLASEEGDLAAVASADRQIGLIHYWCGRFPEALARLEEGLSAAEAAGKEVTAARLKLARGVCLAEMGRHDEAVGYVEEALATAEAMGDPSLLAQANRSLVLLNTWTGRSDKVRAQAERALELARETDTGSVQYWCHWGLAVMEGLTGNTVEMARQLEECERLAEEMHSPVLSLWTTEIRIEEADATGNWDAGIALGERAIALARSLNQEILLPRLMVWTARIYLGRGDLDRGKELIDEAWEISGAGGEGPHNIHTVVPAHIGRASYHYALEEYDETIAVGEAGLAIADRSGYVIWSIHRLLPIICEAYLYKRDLDGAAKLGRRLRKDAKRIGHKLGLAWADACDALVVWLGGDPQRGAALLREAAEALEAVPVIPDAARIRRQLAGRLAEIGDEEGAVSELRRIHETFVRLGAEKELERTRGMFREIGARPPTRSGVTGAAGLTAREVEISRLVAERKSNKAIARALGLSPRTVSTHLSNIYKKLDIGTRGELVDYVRDQVLG
ncbi:MAG: tetratricopeptide repeat protein, partial [Gemmatimonadetes bacterium]|nr:tetratricopeptide repeat protein [Gemmatimonadota bacterium]